MDEAAGGGVEAPEGRGVKFSSAHHAFAFAFEILDCWHAGKAFDPDPEHLGSGGTGGIGGIVHSAIDIMAIADKHDPGIIRQTRPYDRECSWFYLIFIDQPEPKNWTQHERWYLDKAVCAFCEALAEKGIAEKDGCKGKCPGKR